MNAPRRFMTILTIRDCRRTCARCRQIKRTKGGRMLKGHGQQFICGDCVLREAKAQPEGCFT